MFRAIRRGGGTDGTAGADDAKPSGDSPLYKHVIYFTVISATQDGMLTPEKVTTRGGINR